MAVFSEYDQYDGLALAALVRDRAIDPLVLVEAAIDRIAALNPQLNAVIHTVYDRARAVAAAPLPEGPFQGVPFLLKDLVVFDAGVPTRSGSRFLRDFVPDHDSEIVRRYKASGAVILGKTNTPEYGLMPVTEPELFGLTPNPWDLTRNAGGSSGGSAAAVAARIVPLAHGNDGGGSIRIPASCCGVFGFKPSRGRNPLGPDMGEAWQGLACDHVLTRSVRDSAAMLDATAGPDIGAPYYAPPPERPFLAEVEVDPGTLRIAFTAAPFLPSDKVHADCVRALEAAVALCRDLGHEVVEAKPTIDGEAFARAFMTMVCGETRAVIAEAEALSGRKATPREFEPITWALALLGERISAAEFAQAVHVLTQSSRQVGPFFADYDLLMTPTMAEPPIPNGALSLKGAESWALDVLGAFRAGGVLRTFDAIDLGIERVLGVIPFAPLFNATGQPAMSVPLHWSRAGLPIGIHFAGRYADEGTLFRLAGQLERAQPWFDRAPPLVA